MVSSLRFRILRYLYIDKHSPEFKYTISPNEKEIKGGIVTRPPTPIPEKRIQELNDFRKSKWNGYEFQRFLCVWLRVERSMTPVEIAELLGWNVGTVRFTQKSFIDNDVQALTELKRGGRNRFLMTLEEEEDFLSSYKVPAAQGEVLVIGEIKEALEKRLGHPVHKTTIYRILHRHGWRKVSPRPTHPKQDKEACEAFKKGASLKPSQERRIMDVPLE